MTGEEAQIQAARQAVATQQEQINQAQQISQAQLRQASASPMQALLARQEAARQSAIAQQTLDTQTARINQYEKDVAQYREAVRIASPQFQQGAFNEAVRLYSSGYGRLSLPTDDSPFSTAVRNYYNDITKGRKPEWIAEDVNVLQGYKSIPDPELPELPASSVPSPILKLTSQGVNYGKYDTSTNTYISPTGQGYSVPQNKLGEFIASQNIQGISTPLSSPGISDFIARQQSEISQRINLAQQLPAPKTFLDKLNEAYQKAEVFTSSGLMGGKPVGLPTYEQQIAQVQENLKKGFTPEYPILYLQSKTPQAVGKPVYEFLRGTIEEAERYPLKTLGTTAAWMGVSAGLGYLGRGIAKAGEASGISNIIATKVRTTLPSLFFSKISPSDIWTGTKAIAATGLTAAYAKPIIEKIASTPSGQKTYVFGKEFAGNIGPMLAGSYLGPKTAQEIEGIIRTWNRKEIPLSQLVPKDVDIMGGPNKFPLAPTKQHYKLFMTESQRIPVPYRLATFEGKPIGIIQPTNPVMYHSTGEQFWKTGRGFQVVRNPKMATSEFEGLYGSYGVSPYFTRLLGGDNYKLFSTDLITALPKPATAAIIPAAFEEGIPTTTKKGIAFIPGIKREVEAILPVGTRAMPLASQKFYYTLRGVRIPIDQFFSVPKIESGVVKVTPSSSYISAASSPPYGLGAFASSLRLTGKSRISNAKISSLAPYIVSSRISAPSSTPSGQSQPSKPSATSSFISGPSSVSIASPTSPVSPSLIPISPISPISKPVSQVSRTPSPDYSYLGIYRTPPLPIPISIPEKGIKTEKKKQKKYAIGPGYQAFVKRRKKWMPIGPALSKPRAIALGERVTRETLARSFKVVPTKKKVLMQYGKLPTPPSPIVFRQYKFRGKQKIPLSDEWIQKAGQKREGLTIRGASLASIGERREIQASRTKATKANRKSKKIKATNIW